VLPADLWLLWFLVPLFLLWLGARFLFGEWALGRTRRDAAVRFSSIARLKRLRPSQTLAIRRAVQVWRLIVVALLIAAMTRPQSGRRETELTTEGVDIMLAIDTSGSMEALDLESHKPVRERANRLDVVKQVLERFVAKRDQDQIGIVVFGSNAFPQCPLTIDHGVVANALDRVKIGMVGTETAIGDAVGTAVKRLQGSEAKSKVLILLTDGRQNAGSLSPTKAAQIATTFGIKIYTIGAGTRGRAPFPVQGLFGIDYQMQEVSIDERTLKKVASATGGAYFRAEDSTALNEIYDRIDAMERTEIKARSYMEYDERYPWLVIPALLLLLAEVVLLGTRLRKVP